MIIKVLGTGCTKCKSLEGLTRETIEELEIKAELVKIENITDILKYKVASTPALVIDENVIFSGRLPSKEEIKQEILKIKNTI